VNQLSSSLLDKLIIFILILFAWGLLAVLIPYSAAITLEYVSLIGNSVLTSVLLVIFLTIFMATLYFWFYIARKYVKYKVNLLKKS